MTFGRNGLFVRSFVRSLTPISHDREEVFRCGFLRWDGYSIGTNYTKNHLGGVIFFGMHQYSEHTALPGGEAMLG